MLSQTCTRCGSEVRYGTRAGRTGWHHREPVDHNARFGVPVLHPLDSQRLREEWLADNVEFENRDENNEEKIEISTTPEVRATVIDIGDDRMPGGAATVIRAARKTGWDTVATYSRGPWMHTTHWTPTGIADLVLLRLNRGPYHARAMWRRTKDVWKFEHAWVWNTQEPSLEKVNSKALSAFINEEAP